MIFVKKSFIDKGFDLNLSVQEAPGKYAVDINEFKPDSHVAQQSIAAASLRSSASAPRYEDGAPVKRQLCLDVVWHAIRRIYDWL